MRQLKFELKSIPIFLGRRERKGRVILAFFFLPVPVAVKQQLFPLMAVLAVIFSLLGPALIVLTLRQKIKGKLKGFLILTGVSAAGFLISILLHNFIFGLMIFLFGQGFWRGGDEPFFFILALFACPTGFLIGAIGSGWFFCSKRRGEKKK